MDVHSIGMEIRSQRSCVLFTPSDGRIRHVHHVVATEGAGETSGRVIEERTFEVAEQLGLRVAGLEVIELDISGIERGVRYAVDVAGRRLVRLGRDDTP